MVLKRIYNEQLAQASYIVGCPGARVAAVVDPCRDPELYQRSAAKMGLRIVAVLETHIHADFLSGSRELANRTGAKLLLSDEGTPDWKYAFAAEGRAIRDGDSIQIGAVRLDVIATPGHTPEHVSFLITDTATCDQPVGLLSGDFIFVGDVGRPDLLETAAGVANASAPAAAQLYASIQKLKVYGDGLLIWPGHGAGSACGKSLGGLPVTSLGYERATNWAFNVNQEAFVRQVLDGQPDPPKYFAEMKRLNRDGPPMLASEAAMPRLSVAAVHATGGLMLDIRDSEDYLAGHIRGSMHIALGDSFLPWAGWLLPYDQDIVLVANSEDEVRECSADLALIGIDCVCGWVAAGEIASSTLVSSEDSNLVDALKSCDLVLDVRSPQEWAEGHIDGSKNVPLGHLPEHLAELDRNSRILVHCEHGVRSPFGVGVLERAGFEHVANLRDGLAAYR